MKLLLIVIAWLFAETLIELTIRWSYDFETIINLQLIREVIRMIAFLFVLLFTLAIILNGAAE